MTSNIRAKLLAALIIFLPLSAWLVSLTGVVAVSFIRDALLLAVVLLTAFQLPNLSKKQLPLLGLILLLALCVGLSFIGRQDSFLQWLRGARYILEPFILLACLVAVPVQASELVIIKKALLASVILVLVGTLVDAIWPQAIRYSLNSSALGYLGQVHYAGQAVRLQSVLAGPNALGLFLLVAVLLGPIWSEGLSKSTATILSLAILIGLVLTYSRSSYIGVFAGAVALFVWLPSLKSVRGILLPTIIFMGIIGLGAVVILKPSTLTRDYSNVVRVEQYQRVWNQRSQIGWLGRGAGTTGLVSEYALDKSNNYYSEDSYINMYENIGVGALIYIAIWLWSLVILVRTKTKEAAAVAATAVGLCIAGIFIDHYTGQAAIWIALLFVGAYLPVTESSDLASNR